MCYILKRRKSSIFRKNSDSPDGWFLVKEYKRHENLQRDIGELEKKSWQFSKTSLDSFIAGSYSYKIERK